MMLAGSVVFMVDAHDHCNVFFLCGGSDDDLLCPSVDVGRCFGTGQEQACALNNYVDAQIIPWNGRWVAKCRALDQMTINNKAAFLSFDLSRIASVICIIFEEM